MITLLASLTGFISSLIPEIMKYFIDKNDKKHELQILEYQLQSRNTHNKFPNRPDEIIAQSGALEMQALYKTFKTGISWVDSLNGTVRPVLAYSFFFIYTFIKYLQFKLLVNSADLVHMTNILWNVDDQAIFAGIISFYFGQRSVSRVRMK